MTKIRTLIVTIALTTAAVGTVAVAPADAAGSHRSSRGGEILCC